MTADVLCNLYRMEGGLLMWPDMKDRLTSSVYWKLKICSYNIVRYTLYVHARHYAYIIRQAHLLLP